MRGIRFLGMGLLAAVVASLPVVTHATSYRHFTSKTLHFAIDYPSTWSAHYSSASAYETLEQSSSVALTVNYHPAAGFTIKSFTSKLIAAYHKAGISTNAPVISGNRGEFTGAGTVTGHKVLVDVVTMLTSHGAFSIAGAAPKAQLPQLKPLFVHMFQSFSTM